MNTITHEKLESDRILSEQFAQVFRAYLESSDEVQEVIREMCGIVNDPNVDHDDRAAALATLGEALFPVSHNGQLGIDIEDLRNIGVDGSDDVKNAVNHFDNQERSFASRLQQAMRDKALNQVSLAKESGVGQPAISMMLKRHCRPQIRTVERLAAALSMKPEELWPNL